MSDVCPVCRWRGSSVRWGRRCVCACASSHTSVRWSRRRPSPQRTPSPRPPASRPPRPRAEPDPRVSLCLCRSERVQTHSCWSQDCVNSRRRAAAFCTHHMTEDHVTSDAKQGFQLPSPALFSSRKSWHFPSAWTLIEQHLFFCFVFCFELYFFFFYICNKDESCVKWTWFCAFCVYIPRH